MYSLFKHVLVPINKKRITIRFYRTAIQSEQLRYQKPFAACGKMDMSTLIERRTHLERWMDRLLGQAVELPGEVHIRNRLNALKVYMKV